MTPFLGTLGDDHVTVTQRALEPTLVVMPCALQALMAYHLKTYTSAGGPAARLQHTAREGADGLGRGTELREIVWYANCCECSATSRVHTRPFVNADCSNKEPQAWFEWYATCHMEVA